MPLVLMSFRLIIIAVNLLALWHRQNSTIGRIAPGPVRMKKLAKL